MKASSRCFALSQLLLALLLLLAVTTSDGYLTSRRFVVPEGIIGRRDRSIGGILLLGASTALSSSSSYDDEDDEPPQQQPHLLPPLLDPYSDQAVNLLRHEIHLSSSQIGQVQRLADLVCDWNTKVNLVSRKDCSPSTVFTRHILPSLIYRHGLPERSIIMDVGTGGGFPGLLLAIQHTNCDFILLDGVGKKLLAVSDMVEQLGLKNVKAVHHGRVEDYPAGTVDIVTGRGLSDIRLFMGATQHLFRNQNDKKNGRLIYWAGGDTGVDEEEWCCAAPIYLRDQLPQVVDDSDDKRILTFDGAAVQALAQRNRGGRPREPPPMQVRSLLSTSGSGSSSLLMTTSESSNQKKNGTKKNQNKGSSNKQPNNNTTGGKTKKSTTPQLARGAWAPRRGDSAEPKQRGYEGFKRYDSMVDKKRTTTPTGGGGGTAD
jgi:16S rRNA (guanine527-N7)-methyltransferase